jgi:hypothetical protein
MCLETETTFIHHPFFIFKLININNTVTLRDAIPNLQINIHKTIKTSTVKRSSNKSILLLLEDPILFFTLF